MGSEIGFSFSKVYNSLDKLSGWDLSDKTLPIGWHGICLGWTKQGHRSIGLGHKDAQLIFYFHLGCHTPNRLWKRVFEIFEIDTFEKI